ncbi:MAG: hypothetical protein Kow0047_26730 [Anaerolineae bacterium]
MTNRPFSSILEQWPDAWRFAGLIVSSAILALVLVFQRAPSTPAGATTTPLVGVSPALTPTTSPAIVSPPVVKGVEAGKVMPGTPVVLAGEAPPGARVQIYDGDVLLGEVRADDAGRWRVELGERWAPGPHELRVRVVAEEGEIVAVSEPVPITVGEGAAETPAATTEATPTAVAQAPAVALPREVHVPAVLGLGAAPGISATAAVVPVTVRLADGERVEVEGSPALEGTAPAGAVVRVFDVHRLVGEVVAAEDSTWELQGDERFPPGDHIVWAEARSASDEVLGVSEPLFFSVAPQGKLSITAPAEGEVIKEPRPLISGAGQPGVVVRVYVGSRAIGETVAGEDGSWALRPEIPLPAGEQAIRAAVVDEQGRAVTESEPVPVLVQVAMGILPTTGAERPEPELQAEITP